MGKQQGPCRIQGCGRKISFKGMCGAHYQRAYKHGSPGAGGTLRGEPLQFYETVVLKFVGDDCLIWPYARSSAGYAQINNDGRVEYIHRRLCSEVHGAPPAPELEAAHSCGQGHLGCVNQMHLSWKTPSENQMDRAVHGTSNRGERQWNAKLTSDDVRCIRRLISKTLTDLEIAEQFGVSATAIRAIRTGRSWSWLDYPQEEIAA